LRHPTFDDNARTDLPEWLEYMREFTGGPDLELALVNGQAGGLEQPLGQGEPLGEQPLVRRRAGGLAGRLVPQK
jgi:hypothetical protein